MSPHLRGAGALLALLLPPASGAGAQSGAPAIRPLFTQPGANILNTVALSPNGRWVVYVRAENTQRMHLWVRAADGTGAALQLTRGEHVDVNPRFSPTGERVVFASSLPLRGGEGQPYLMTIPFDQRTGRPTGAPRQLTIEGVRTGANPAFAVSPDGGSVAYASCCATPQLRLVPINGGRARTLVASYDPPGQGHNIAWSSDGRSVLYVLPTPARGGLSLMRVASTGGTPTELRRLTFPIGRLSPDGSMGAQVIPFGANNQQRELRVRDTSGTVLARVPLPSGASTYAAWSMDGRSLVGVHSEQGAVVRLVSTDGQGTRRLTQGRGYDWVDAWSPDGRTVWVSTRDSGRDEFVGLDLQGRVQRRVPRPTGEVGTWNAVIGEWAVGSSGWIDSTTRRLVARRLTDGPEVALGANHLGNARGPGGTYGVDGDAYVYMARENDRFVMRRVAPGRPSQLLRAFTQPFARFSTAVSGGWVAFTQTVGDSMALSVATGPDDGDVRRIAMLPGSEARGELAWSADRRTLVFNPRATPSTVLAFALDADGRPAGAMRRLELPFEYFYELSLLPDGRRMTMIAQPRGAPNTVVALVSVDDPSHPMLLSQQDGAPTWGHLLSPDGKWVAYSSELRPEGSTVYRVDLPKVVKP